MGANWQSIVNGFQIPTYIIGGLIIIALAVVVWRYIRQRRAVQAAEPDATGQQRLDPVGQTPGSASSG